MELHRHSAVEIAASVRAGKLRASEVAEHFLERIDRLDGQLHAFVTVDRDGARRAAAAVDTAVARGDDPGPLAGVPVALKDNLVTRGLATTCGSRILETWRPPYDGSAARRLRAAGALIVGKTNMDEFGMGSSTEHSAFGPCRNPWDRKRVPGGSSGGSAAAVAARLCLGALGTDTGGSIRQPAALCGVVGLKPTYGRVSRFGVVAFASSLDQVGPLAGSVEDAALLLEAIAGHDPRDATSSPAPVDDYRAACAGDIAGLRIGVPAEYFAARALEPEVDAAVRAGVEQLRELGAQLVDVSLPHTDHSVAAYYLLCMAEASSNLARYDGVRYGLRAGQQGGLAQMYRQTRHDGFGAEVKRRVLLGTFVLSAGYHDAYYGKAQRVRTLIRRDFDAAFERCDALVTPTTPGVAFPLGERVEDPLKMYMGDLFTNACSLAGLPGMSIPCGTGASQLPVGMQLIGPPLGEPRLLSIASAFERATGHHAQLCELADSDGERGA